MYSPWVRKESIGLQRVEHDWATFTHSHRFMQLNTFDVLHTTAVIIHTDAPTVPSMVSMSLNKWASGTFWVLLFLLLLLSLFPPSHPPSPPSSLSCIPLFATPQIVAHQAPCLSMGFSRQEYWSGWPFPSPGDLPDTEIEPRSPALQADSLPSELPGSYPSSP